MSSTSTPPFHRLLSFYSNRSPHPDTQTIRLYDSLTGNLALGLDFPAALAIALGRHLFLSNTGFFSLNIHVPSVKTHKTLLDGLEVDEKRSYTASEMWGIAAPNGLQGRLDAVGLWALAADTKTGRLSGEDVRSFQEGRVLGVLEERRKGRGQVLPLWRGGPISVVGHSEEVKED
ncbi:uncharacterized protein LTR77_003273 [Saxophila tyrrhenica]|uniref:Uncharacterized protein n=1 Tax=Saxophila tyrrhenica TaxID=1690608 RepID=A0AAV9PGW5_9PEZI|nr:hypothetical protein LTR77_003273 [Saxophila tyrrhenica]